MNAINVRLLLIGVLLFAGLSSADAQQGYVLRDGITLEIRVVSKVNKKGRKEKVYAFVHRPVRDDSGSVVIREHMPVEVKTRKIKQKGGSNRLQVDFVRVNSVNGQKIVLRGSAYISSLVVNDRERRDNTLVNLAMLPMGYITPLDMEKRVRTPQLTIIGNIEVNGDHLINR